MRRLSLLLIHCCKLMFVILKLYQVPLQIVIHLVAEGLFKPSFLVHKPVHQLNLNI